jgi:hypothetical protein
MIIIIILNLCLYVNKCFQKSSGIQINKYHQVNNILPQNYFIYFSFATNLRKDKKFISS